MYVNFQSHKSREMFILPKSLLKTNQKETAKDGRLIKSAAPTADS